MNYTSYTEDFVKELYYRIGILRPQKLDFGVISYKMGIDVFYWNKPSQALFLNEFAWIFLNNHLSPQQIWQDFCHELGHVLLHVGNQKRMTESFRKYQEYKANHFMYHACVPTFMLHEMEESISVKKIIQVFNVEEKFAEIRLEQYANRKLDITNWNVQS